MTSVGSILGGSIKGPEGLCLPSAAARPSLRLELFLSRLAVSNSALRLWIWGVGRSVVVQVPVQREKTAAAAPVSKEGEIEAHRPLPSLLL